MFSVRNGPFAETCSLQNTDMKQSHDHSTQHSPAKVPNRRLIKGNGHTKEQERNEQTKLEQTNEKELHITKNAHSSIRKILLPKNEKNSDKEF